MHKIQQTKHVIWCTLVLLLLGFATQTFSQTATMETLPPPNRTLLVSRPLVFSRTQSQYNLYFNYLHYYTPEWYWIDRPLFFDRSLAPADYPGSALTEPSFMRIMDSAKPYEIDGFSHLTSSASQQKNYLSALEFAGKRPDHFPILLEVGPAGTDVDKAVASIEPLLEKALASPVAPRVDGKVLITSYNLDYDSPKTWAKILDELHQKYGNTFLLVASIGRDWWPFYNSGHDGVYPADQLEKLKAKLRSWLDVCDGIMYTGMSDTSNNTTHQLDQGLYEFIIRACSSVLNEPAYRKKYFGLSAANGYFNPITNHLNDEAGTKYLRNSLQIALAGHPDFIILPEWDEVNENTTFEPTVYNSFAVQRILRYEMRQLKNAPQTPQLDDNVSIPNLVISYRPFLMLGEPLQVEILNVPDNSAKGNYTLQLSLKDINHKTVKVLSSATLSADELRDKTFMIPTEELANYPVLMPSLEVTSPNGKTQTFEDGLSCIHLRPTMNWNYKYVKMPLRDLLHPDSATFSLTEEKSANGSVKVQGSVSTNEQIASMEVVADGRELYAVDPAHTWELKPDEALIMMHELAPDRINNYNGKYFVTGGTVRKVNDQFAYWGTRQPNQIAPTLTWSPLGEIFIVDHKDTAVLHVENSIYKTAIPISQILKDGIYSEVHNRGVTLTIRDFHGVAEMPLPLNTTKSTFATTVHPMRTETTLQMRVITKSGKIYRSWPILLQPKSSNKVSLPVYSQIQNKAVYVQIDQSRIPQIDVEPARAISAQINSATDHYFDGLVGGIPFWSYIARGEKAYPTAATQTAPVRVTEDGNDCWKFDGRGNFLYLPPETLPRGAFTLSFTFKPTSAKRQTLLINRGYGTGAFQLTLDNGQLSGSYTDQLSRKEPYYHTIKLNPEISVPIGEWSTVEISYNLQQMIFTVNGKSSKPIPLATKGISYTPLLFGGYGDGKYDGYFEGFLKDLKITHSA